MRNFSHLSARYVRDRIGELIYQKKNPEKPWLTPQACEILDDLIRPSDHVLEFGSGRSTRWFAKHAGAVTSIEHNPEWFAIVTQEIQKNGISNVDLRLVENISDYSAEADGIVSDGSIDIALVDGVMRDTCAVVAARKVRAGGVIIIDDSHRYFPSTSHVPGALVAGQDAFDADSRWPEFMAAIDGYRIVRTSSGVSDTTLFFAV